VPEITVRGPIGGREITLATGKLAVQAGGAVTVTLGDTQVLVTATANADLREGVSFFPLTVDVEERMYAAGRIPGSFFRREGRATERAILTCRLIDRPLRPSFAEGFRHETQVVSTILSVDMENPYDVVSLIGASAALSISGIPFDGPIGAVRLGLKDGEWIAMPTFAELEESVFDLVVAGRRNEQGEIDIMMVEAGATENGIRLIEAGAPPSDEATVAGGLSEAKKYIAETIDLQEQLASQVDVPAVSWQTVQEYSDELYERVAAIAAAKAAEIVQITAREERTDAETALAEETVAALQLEDESEITQVKRALKALLKKEMRRRVLAEGIRLDGRGPKDIRPLTIEVGVVPRTHGSGLFQRGETQVLNLATLGMPRMEQMLDNLSIEETKRYMHHYNFPPFSTGEAGFMRGPRRREIGHGALAEKAVLPVVPAMDEFPYALRLVSEVLSSNGSTSMASVCASSLSLMDAGVPITEPVAGIAMGLVAEDDQYVTLTDILGAEDALGDMDFKVAGTAGVITALQMDTKIQGLPSEVLVGALEQAREARLFILEKMREVIPAARSEVSSFAPRIETLEIPRDKIGEVIGPKGKMIRQIEEQTGASVEIEEPGIVRIGAADTESLNKALEIVRQIAFPPEPEVGEVYEGEVVNITKFGAFVNIFPGRDGLLHISKLGAGKRVDNVEDYLELGQKVKVTIREIDRSGKLSLDLAESAEGAEQAEDRDRPRDRTREADRRGGRGSGRSRRDGDGGRRSTESGEAAKPAEKPGRKVVSFEEEFAREQDR
jgi:polyribonucleotide nucleotidyltransferase